MMKVGGILFPIQNYKFAHGFAWANNLTPPPPPLLTPTVRKLRATLEEMSLLSRGWPRLAAAKTASSASASASPVNGALFPSAQRERELIYCQWWTVCVGVFFFVFFLTNLAFGQICESSAKGVWLGSVGWNFLASSQCKHDHKEQQG